MECYMINWLRRNVEGLMLLLCWSILVYGLVQYIRAGGFS